MAKKGSTTRVFQLARELGVSSKDIIAKCEAEDIPGITNHMSAVSLGLAATIHEWFSEGAKSGSTAVETAAPVDVVAAKRKVTKKAAKKKAKAKPKDDAPNDDADAPVETETTTVVADPPVAAPPPVTPRPVEPTVAPEAPKPTAIPITPPAPVETPAAVEPTTEPAQVAADAPAAPAAEAPSAPAAEAPSTPSPEAPSAPEAGGEAPSTPGGDGDAPAGDAPQMNVPQRPNVVSPAGPMLNVPKKTALAGPKVIRVESPEPAPAPRRPRTGGPGGGGGGGGMARGGPRAGRGVGAGPMGGPNDMMMGGPRTGGGKRGGGGAGGKGSRQNPRRSGGAGAGGRDGRPGRTGLAGGGAGDNRSFHWREQDLLERENRLNRASGFFGAARRDKAKRRAGGGARATTAAESGGTVKVEEPITLKSLSAATGVRVNQLIQKLVKSGEMVAGQNALIETAKAEELMLEWGIELDVVEQKSAEDEIVESFKDREMVDEQSRPPVVTILGHVDHGKTTLLDSIRSANVAGGEAGGITQATSAFRVPVTVGDDERTIAFIDTPGHEAFTEMRSRGAKVTDIVVLVVAADDGVMPQTIESINHAKAADVPIIVALNKVDKQEATDANIQRILGQLAEHELSPTDWGGSTEVIRIAALKGEGVTDLLEVIDLQAQMLELSADFGGQAEGTVIEAQMEEGRGAVARLLVQQGKLKKGDFIAVGRAYGRVRDIVDDRGERIKEAGPSTPVAISGLNEVPDAGDRFYVVKNLRAAEAAAAERKQQERERDLATEKVTLDNIFEKLAESGRKELPLIVKADVQGSLETLKAQLPKIGSDEVKVVIKHGAVGGVNESDVMLAEASGAIVVGFNVTAAGKARKAAEQRNVDIRFYDVIYDLTDDVKAAAEGLLDPELTLEVLGHAEVREVFKISKVGMIAGCYVTDGTIERHAQIRVTRDDIVIEKDRRLEQLKRFKDDAKEVNSGQECGMKIEGYNDIRVGDVLECYRTKEVRRTL